MKIAKLSLLCLFIVGCYSKNPDPIKLPTTVFTNDGWQCHATFEEFNHAGAIVQQTSDGKSFTIYDYRDFATEQIAEIPEVIGKQKVTIGGVLDFLASVSDLPTDIEVSGNLSSNVSNTSVSYNDTRKQMILNPDFKKIIGNLKEEELDPDSEYVLIRESYTAKNVNIVLNKQELDNLKLGIDIPTIVKASAIYENETDDQYILNREFSKRLGICTLTFPLGIKYFSLDGVPEIEVGDTPVRLKQRINLDD